MTAAGNRRQDLADLANRLSQTPVNIARPHRSSAVVFWGRARFAADALPTSSDELLLSQAQLSSLTTGMADIIVTTPTVLTYYALGDISGRYRARLGRRLDPHKEGSRLEH